MINNIIDTDDELETESEEADSEKIYNQIYESIKNKTLDLEESTTDTLRKVKTDVDNLVTNKSNKDGVYFEQPTEHLENLGLYEKTLIPFINEYKNTDGDIFVCSKNTSDKGLFFSKSELITSLIRTIRYAKNTKLHIILLNPIEKHHEKEFINKIKNSNEQEFKERVIIYPFYLDEKLKNQKVRSVITKKGCKLSWSERYTIFLCKPNNETIKKYIEQLQNYYFGLIDTFLSSGGKEITFTKDNKTTNEDLNEVLLTTDERVSNIVSNSMQKIANSLAETNNNINELAKYSSETTNSVKELTEQLAKHSSETTNSVKELTKHSSETTNSVKEIKKSVEQIQNLSILYRIGNFFQRSNKKHA